MNDDWFERYLDVMFKLMAVPLMIIVAGGAWLMLLFVVLKILSVLGVLGS